MSSFHWKIYYIQEVILSQIWFPVAIFLVGASTESLGHIFIHCSFSTAMLAMLPPSIMCVFLMGLNNGRSPQLKEFWLICFTLILWIVWHARNKIRFDSRSFSIVAACRLISGHIQVASRLAMGPSKIHLEVFWCWMQVEACL